MKNNYLLTLRVAIIVRLTRTHLVDHQNGFKLVEHFTVSSDTETVSFDPVARVIERVGNTARASVRSSFFTVEVRR